MFAGQYGPEVMLGEDLRPAANQSAHVRLPGSATAAVLYADREKAVMIANPTATDSLGQLTFLADPGQYDVVIGTLVRRVTVPIDPVEAAQDGDVVAALNAHRGDPDAHAGTYAPLGPEGEVSARELRLALSPSVPDWSILPIAAHFDDGPATFVDDVVSFGFNQAGNSVPQDPTQAMVWVQMEARFKNPQGPFGSEFHLNFVPPGGGATRRPINCFMTHDDGLNHLEFDGRIEFWNSPRTKQRMVLDVERGGALHLLNGTFLQWTAAVGAGSDAMLICQRSDGRQLLRFTASGNLGIGTWNQFGGGQGVIAIANAVARPTTNPTGGGVLFAEGGALKWRGPAGRITTLAPA